MENKPYRRIDVSRPQDQTLEAYRAWMTAMAKQLTMGKNEIQWTEEQWNLHWKEFWKEKPGD